MYNFGRFGFLTLLVQFLFTLISYTNAQALDVINGTYKLPAQFDPEVTTSLRTELWAQVWRPSTGGPYPLLVFLHGNHATCGRFDAGLGIRIDDNSSYTTTGTCPSGYVVAPSHAGYNYLAKPLASQGYVVVSINANRGINAAGGEAGDAGLNLRRGRLVLRHLEELSKWNSGVSSPPASLGFSMLGLMDFSQVGLMGHSRGGEGMRAALAQYRDAGSPWPARIGAVGFRALFEIGPVDGQTSRILNAGNVAWNVLLPGCDGDVSDLQGIKPFDRMVKAGAETQPFNKSTFDVYGANHNFYNTQWQQSDAFGCDGQTAIFPQILGSASQRTTAAIPLNRFFRAHVGPAAVPALAQRILDPSFPLPAALTAITQYARGFSPTVQATQYFVVDDFDKATGISTQNVANQSSGLTAYVHGNAGFSHDSTQRAARVEWSSPTGFLQLNDTTSAAGINVSAFRALEFRVGLLCFTPLCSANPNATGDVDFSVSIANANGTQSSSVTLKSLAVVRRPVGSFGVNIIMQTVRVPLSQFTGAQLTAFKGVRFTFNQTTSSKVYLANVRLDKTPTGPGGLASLATARQVRGGAIVRTASPGEVNRIVAIRHTRAEAGQSVVEIEVSSSRAFPVSNALPVLTIGEKSFNVSRFASPDGYRMVFTVPADEYAKVQPADVSVRIGGAAPWRFGRLTKQ